MMIPALWALLAAVGPSPAAPLPKAEFAVFEPDDPTDALSARSDLAEQTHRLLAVMSDLHLIDYRRSTLRREQVASCLSGGPDPDPERRACLRRTLASEGRKDPLVVIVIGFTAERGAWQRMECIGPRAEGESRYVYVFEAFHPRADIRESTRRDVLKCVADALRA